MHHREMHARHSKDRIAIDQRAQDWAAHRSHPRRAQAARLCSIFAALVVTLALSPTALADPLPNLTVIGVAPNGTETPLTDYRWLVEEDQTYHVPVNPDETAMGGVNFDPNWQQGSDGHDGGQTLSVSFHDSYMPVVAKGCSGDAAWQTAATCSDVPFPSDPGTKRYYVSVVPRSGYSIGGAEYVPGTGATVYVHEHPIQTAQITILIFEDNNSINGAPDLPQEDPATPGNPPMDGFTIVVEDAGGRYGASAGVQSLDAFGNPLGTTYSDTNGTVSGFAPLITGPDGRLTIKNLAPGKYGISAVPPPAQGWQQTSTIEGTKIIDAWVKANEPPFFAEFGPPGFHVFIGFVTEFDDLGGGASITGKVVNQHMSRPPDYAFYNGACFGHTTPWVGLNEVTGGLPGNALYAAPTTGDCDFEIAGVPDGDYQLVVWDSALDVIIAFKGISIAGGVCNTPTGCDLLEVPVFQWFHRQEHRVFDDENGDGIWDADEGPINDQANILRWRDGTVYQENVTDFTGAYTFDQIFPFFSWLVAEVDFARFEATGLTAVVDNGGAIPASSPGFPGEPDFTFGRTINPQDQTNPADPACTDPFVCTETAYHRTDLGPVLTAGFQGFIGQTSAFLWGKRHYPDIPGFCADGITECTSNADCAAPETCDAPGLAYNGGISGIVFYAITRAEDDPEFAAAEPWEPGIPGVTVNLYESVSINPVTGVGVRGALLNSTTTDSWDDAIPTGCKWGNGATATFSFSPDGINFFPQDCYDGLRAFNQVRPAVFDGGYAFGDVCTDDGGLDPGDGTCPGDAWQGYIPPGDYIVEVIPPLGYEILKPEDKNVDFGDVYEPEPELLPAPCVGELALIPPYLTLFPDEEIAAPFAGTERPLCDRKAVTLSSGANAAADFWFFTEVPVAAHGNGFILDDTQNEFDLNSPNFGEKYAPPFVPVTIRDWSGRVIGKTISDQYGTYNFLAPSTITTNLPAPSGMSPNMLTTCMNDPGDDPNNPDPNWNQQYSTFCYNFQYMPGVTTYLDTPVVPVAAFTGPDQFPLDCELPDGTPRIWEVQGDGIGPYVASAPGDITIASMGTTSVQNPEYCNPAAGACPTGADTVNKFISRDYGFGSTQGQVYIGDQLIPAADVTWGAGLIGATLPAGTTTGQLRVIRGDNQAESVTAVTVQVGLRPGASVAYVTPTGGALAHDIQGAIDMAGANDLILVGCGQANEMVVMWKPVQLQGSGECTIINAVKAPTDKLDVWRGMVDGLIANGDVDLLPGQEVGTGNPEPATLWTEEGAGILVLAKRPGDSSAFDEDDNKGARIDGITIRGADTGGGIIANGYAKYLQISNNRISNNSGFYAGGIRVGHPILTSEQPDGDFDYTDAHNDYVSIHRNQVVFNGGLGGVGGGISMCTGSDSYKVTENWVCGNLTLGEGGGIGHTGKSGGGSVTERRCSATPGVLCDNNNDCPALPGTCEATPDACENNAECPTVPGTCSLSLTACSNNGECLGECTFDPGEFVCSNNGECTGICVGNNGTGLLCEGQQDCPGGGNQCNANQNQCNANQNACVIEENVCNPAELVESDIPLIANNTVIFNEGFFQGSTVSGGGIFIGGAPALPLAPNGLTPGSGNVQLISNLIQGNSAGAGDGGGVRLARINGQDLLGGGNNAATRENWYAIDLFDNMIVDNVSALAGGGISMMDAVKVRLVHNTIANNDSMATAGEAFAPGSPNQSTPQDGAGIAARMNSPELDATRNDNQIGDYPLDPQKSPSFRDEFADNIIWQNRQFFFWIDSTSGCAPGSPDCLSTFGLCPDVTGALDCPGGNTVVYDDLGVPGTPGAPLACDPLTSCILTGDPDPLFVAEYVNGSRSSVLQPEITTAVQTPAAFDEGGNFIRLNFGPLSLYDDPAPNNGDPGTLFGDYHIQGISPAIDGGDDLTGTYPELLLDIDGEPRPAGSGVDIGADEVQP